MSNYPEIVPQVNSTGFYAFRDPVALDPTKLYTVMSVQPISNLLRRVMDAKKIVYDVWGLSEEVYNAAVADDRTIIALSHNGGTVHYVPSDYITKFPDVGAVEYKFNAISLALDYLPVGTNLDALKEALERLSLEYVGVTATARVGSIGESVYVSTADHKINLGQRAAAKNVAETTAGRCIRLERENKTLNERVAFLEELLVAGTAPESTTP